MFNCVRILMSADVQRGAQQRNPFHAVLNWYIWYICGLRNTLVMLDEACIPLSPLLMSLLLVPAFQQHALLGNSQAGGKYTSAGHRRWIVAWGINAVAL